MAAVEQQTSVRRDVCESIAAFIRDHDLANPYGGDVSRQGEGRKSYYATHFSIPAQVDGEIRVYNPAWIMVRFQHRGRNFQHIFGSEDHAIGFMTQRFISWDQEAAEAIPTRA
jgi:hypothetical protein